MANYNRSPSEIILHLLAISGLFMTVNGRLLKTLEDTVVLVNDSIRLSCQSDKSEEIHFFHNGKHMYAGGTLNRPWKDRFKMETIENHTYTLVNEKAGPEDAGVYKCHDVEARGQSSSATLTVLNTRLLCESNMHANGYIGPNTCNLQQEKMTFSCSVSFNGTSPRLVWRSSNDNSQPINSSVCDHQPNRVNCRLTLTSDPSYDGTVFTCLTAQPSGTQYNCSTKVIKVQYFALDHELKPVEKTVDEEVECSVRSNLNPRFKWSLSEDNQETVVGNTSSHVIQKHGLYWCNVSYSIRDAQCSSMAAVIYAHKSVELALLAHSSATFGILAFLLFCIAIIVALFIYIWHLKTTNLNKKRTKFSAEKLELEKKLFQPSKETVPYAEKPELVENIITKASLELKRAVYGIAILEDKLFVISKECKEIEVYQLNDLKIAPKVHQIVGLKDPRDMVSCSANNCLYIRNDIDEDKSSEIIKVSSDGKVAHRWTINKSIGHLSIGNVEDDTCVIVAVWDGSEVLVYTRDGVLIRDIKISNDASIDSFRHVISLQSGYFVLCHGDNKDEQHRLCIIGDHGHLIKSFGSTPGNSKYHVNLPAYLARDEDDAIIVADRKNERVLLLTPQLEFKRELIKENGLVNPWRVCLDMKRGFLLVADNIYEQKEGNFEGRVLVYKIVKSNIYENALLVG